jgi:hypothetical protein
MRMLGRRNGMEQNALPFALCAGTYITKEMQRIDTGMMIIPDDLDFFIIPSFY